MLRRWRRNTGDRHKVIVAAFDAVHSGVSISLLVAGCVILFSGLIAWLTFKPERLRLEEQV